MRSREGLARPCAACKKPTRFQLELRGRRGGHLRWLDCCCECGENNSTHDRLLKEAK